MDVIDQFMENPLQFIPAHWVLIGAVLLIAFMVWKLARSVEVSESGRVDVVYHSPLKWLQRFRNIDERNRAAMTPRTKKFVSMMYRSSRFMGALQMLIFGLLFSVLGGFIALARPLDFLNVWIIGMFLVGIVLIIFAVRGFRRIGVGNPYESDD